MRRSLAHDHAQRSGNALDAARIHRLARAFMRQVEAFDGSCVAEMRGIARSAEIAFEDILLLNGRAEIVHLAKRGAEADPDGRTGAILLPQVTEDGVLLHGQNWDWKSECAETGVVWRIRREAGPDILTFLEAGGTRRAERGRPRDHGELT